jgi:leader peptidase (prepilin peptidase) / N-methyltransferase
MSDGVPRSRDRARASGPLIHRIRGTRIGPKGDAGWRSPCRGRRKPALPGESVLVNAAAGFAGLLLGLAVGPVADRIATNAPMRRPLLGRVPRSSRLPVVTAATALLGGASGLAFGFAAEALIAAFFCWVLVIVTRTDFEYRLIPNRIVVPGTLLVLAARTLDEPSPAWLLGALGAGVVLFVIVLAYPKGMGMGDVKLAAFLGAGLGASVIVALFIGFLAAFVHAAVLLVRHGKAARKRAIPLGPFLALGGVVALFAGDEILDWYLNIGL